MVCFAVRIFSRIGTRLLGNPLCTSLQVRYLTELIIARYLTELRGTLAGTLRIAFPLMVVKVLYHFMMLFVKGKMNFFAQDTRDETSLKHWNCQGLSLLCVVNNCHKDSLSSASGTLARACSIFSNCSGVTGWVLLTMASSFGGFELEDPSSVL